MEKPNAKERFSQNVCLLKKGNNIMQQKERERERLIIMPTILSFQPNEGKQKLFSFRVIPIAFLLLQSISQESLSSTCVVVVAPLPEPA